MTFTATLLRHFEAIPTPKVGRWTSYFHFTVLVWMMPILAALQAQAAAADWPQFLGPDRNGIYSGPPLAAKWPNEGPTRLWSRDVGQGFSGPVATTDRVLIFHRVDDQETLECMEARSGKAIWKDSTSTHYRDDFGFDEGPRATPAIANGRVLTLGAEGTAIARDFSTGKKLWSLDCKKEFSLRKGFFGLAPSPLIVGSNVILNIGGTDRNGIIALNVQTGRKAWTCTDDEASYASPVLTQIGTHERVLVLTREALVSVDPKDGHVLFRYPWRPAMHASVSAATPLVLGDRIFLSASYGAGATLLQYSESGPSVIWKKEELLSNHYATSVVKGDLAFGFDGRQEQGCNLRCVSLREGSVVWEQEGLGAGTVMIAGKELLILTEKGELIRTPADRSGFHPSARHQLLPFLARAHPALSDGIFFARSKNKLFAFDLNPTSPSASQ